MDIKNITFEEIEKTFYGDMPFGEFIHKYLIEDKITIYKVNTTDNNGKEIIIFYFYDAVLKIYRVLTSSILTDLIIPSLNLIADELLEKANNETNKLRTHRTFKGNISKKSKIDEALIEVFRRCKGNPEFFDKLDTIEHELPIKGGKVINLRTGIIKDRTKDNFFSYELKVEYVDKTDYIEKKMREIATDENEKYEYIHRFMGYCLTSVPVEKDKVFIILIGKGNNGKSLCTEGTKGILGDKFFASIPKSLFVEQKPKPQEKTIIEDRIKLYKAKIGICPELEEGARLNIPELKMLTGGDTINGRYLGNNKIQFKNTCKLVASTNHAVHFKKEEAILERIRIIHFNSKFVKEPKLKNEYKIDVNFRNELETTRKNEFFSWIVQGAMKYFKMVDEGKRPFDLGPIMKKECEKALNEVDDVLNFLNENTIKDAKSSLSFQDLYNRFKEVNPLSNTSYKRFNNEVVSRGYFYKKSSVNFWCGIKLKDNDLEKIEKYENNEKLELIQLRSENKKLSDELLAIKEELRLLKEQKNINNITEKTTIKNITEKTIKKEESDSESETDEYDEDEMDADLIEYMKKPIKKHSTEIIKEIEKPRIVEDKKLISVDNEDEKLIKTAKEKQKQNRKKPKAEKLKGYKKYVEPESDEGTDYEIEFL